MDHDTVETRGRACTGRATAERSRRARRLVAGVALAGVALVSSCSGDTGSGGSASSGSPSGTASGPVTGGTSPGSAPKGTAVAVDRPDGPAADVSQELTGGDGVFIGAAEPADLGDAYVEHEYVAEGSAVSYAAVGELTPDGRWTLEEGPAEDYRTRIVVRRPESPDDFSGTVVVEWLNVSGGVDADPDFVTLREELLRQGHAWVGVSAQRIGVEGGPVAVQVDAPGAEAAGKGIKNLDPERYGTLSHPGDAYAFDIFTQVARALREGGDVLGGVTPEHLIAAGESQSAFAMVTYVNGVQPETEAFDGFFVHSRGGAGMSIPAPGESSDIASSLGGVKTILRTDTEVPIFELQAENDVIGTLGSVDARQPDTDTFRLWEVAGTAHADTHLAGPQTAEIADCGLPVNDGPMHVVAKAALRHLVTWIETGEAPPTAPLLQVAEGNTAIVRDADGIAQGGVRTPPVAVPTRILSGEKGPNASIICLLFGSTAPMPPERIAELYPSRAAFEDAYGAAVDGAIDAGYVLEEDRELIEGYAHPELVPG